MLPSDAFIPDIRGEKVLVCRNGQAATAYVTTGIRTENEVQVVTGINPMDTVIISGLAPAARPDECQTPDCGKSNNLQNIRS